jgi:hypothetical protein
MQNTGGVYGEQETENEKLSKIPQTHPQESTVPMDQNYTHTFPPVKLTITHT